MLANELKIGWDNAPHHTQFESFPHHKHVGKQRDLQASEETCLEEVMGFIQIEINGRKKAQEKSIISRKKSQESQR